MNGTSAVSIRSFRTEPEALSVVARFEAEGIPCRIARIDPFGVTPIVGFAQGVELLVSPEYEERARELLAAFDSGLLEVSLDPAESDKPDDGKQIDTDEKIREDVESIRRRWRLVWIVVFACIPVVFIVARLKPEAILDAFLLWMALYGVVGLRAALSRCPRCKRYVYQNWGRPSPQKWKNYWDRKCIHCGLSLRRG